LIFKDLPMFGYVLIVLAIYVGIAGLLYVFQRNLQYFPDTERPSRQSVGAASMEEVDFATEDGLRLFAWYGAAEEGRPTIVFFHGNAGHLGGRAYKARRFLERGIGVLLVEYRGYGGNPGTPDEQGLYADGRAALEWLAQKGIGSENTVLYGESLGSGVAVQMAYEKRGGALVLETPFTSLPDVGQHHYFWLPVRWLVRDRFDSKKKIGQIAIPILVLHGTADKTVPIKFGKALFELANQPKTLKVFEGGEHNDLYRHGAAETVLEFIFKNYPATGIKK